MKIYIFEADLPRTVANNIWRMFSEGLQYNDVSFIYLTDGTIVSDIVLTEELLLFIAI